MDRRFIMRRTRGRSLAFLLILAFSSCSSKPSKSESAKVALATMQHINGLDLTVKSNQTELKKYCTPKGSELLLAIAQANPASYKRMLAPPYSGSPSSTNGVCRIPLADPPFIEKGYFKLVLHSGVAGFVHKLLPILGDNNATWKLDDIFIASGSDGKFNIFYSNLICQEHIAMVVWQDRQATDLFSASDYNHPNWPQDYIAAIKRINTADCPKDFQNAYKDLVKAGQRILLSQSWKLARMAFFTPADEFTRPDEMSKDERRALNNWVVCRENIALIAVDYGATVDAVVWGNAITRRMHQADKYENQIMRKSKTTTQGSNY